MGNDGYRDECSRQLDAAARKPGGGRFCPTLAVLGLSCFSLLLFGCGKPEVPTLRIAINAWPGYELIYLAQEKGFFGETGVEVRLVEFGSLSDARRAYETGKVDGLATTTIEVLMARDATPRDLRIVRVLDFSSGADVIVAGAATRSMADLRGKRIGVELASLGVYVLARALELEGMALADVEPVSKDQKTMREAFLARELDAVVAYPPESVALLRDPRFRVVFSSLQIPGEVVDVMALDGDVLRQRPAQVQAFLQGLDRAFDYMQQHPDEACRIMAEREGLSAQEFQHLLTDGMTLVAPGDQGAYLGAGGKLQSAVQGAARFLRQVKLISSRPEVTDCLHTDE